MLTHYVLHVSELETNFHLPMTSNMTVLLKSSIGTCMMFQQVRFSPSIDSWTLVIVAVAVVHVGCTVTVPNWNVMPDSTTVVSTGSSLTVLANWELFQNILVAITLQVRVMLLPGKIQTVLLNNSSGSLHWLAVSLTSPEKCISSMKVKGKDCLKPYTLYIYPFYLELSCPRKLGWNTMRVIKM